VTRKRTRLAVTLGCLVVAVAGLFLLAGLPGVLGGLLIAGLWLGVTAPVAFAVAHLVVVLVVAGPDSTLAVVESVPFVLTELGLLGALAVSTIESRTWRATLTVTLGSGLLLLGGLGLALTAIETPWAVGLLVVLGVGGVLYAVHRVERVQLGLVTEDIE
jgi:hypothetical protein